MVSGHGVSVHKSLHGPLWPCTHLALTPLTLYLHPTQPSGSSLHSFSPLCPHRSFWLCPCPSSSSSNVTLPTGRSDLSLGYLSRAPPQPPAPHRGPGYQSPAISPPSPHRKVNQSWEGRPSPLPPFHLSTGPWGSQHSVNVCLIESGQAASSRLGPG